MSTQVFPTFTGIGFPIERTPIWSTDVQEAISGKENRIVYQTYPRYEYQIDLNLLKASNPSDFQTFIGFYNLRQGQFDSWLYADTTQSSVSSQLIATGNGATSSYQLVNTLGGFIEPVLAPNVVSSVYLAGVSIPSSGISAPTNGALTVTSSGALAANTRYVRSTWNTNSGQSLPATETSLVVASSGRVLNVAAPSSAPSSAISWSVYAANSSGAETLQSSNIPLGSSWVQPSSGFTSSGAAPPSSNTTGWSVSNWGTATPGYLNFQGNVVSSIAITADFTFYYPCRFMKDKQMFSLKFNNVYESKKISFITLKS